MSRSEHGGLSENSVFQRLGQRIARDEVHALALRIATGEEEGVDPAKGVYGPVGQRLLCIEGVFADVLFDLS